MHHAPGLQITGDEQIPVVRVSDPIRSCSTNIISEVDHAKHPPLVSGSAVSGPRGRWKVIRMALLAQLPVRQLSSASTCISSTRGGNETCNAAILLHKPWHSGRPLLLAQPRRSSTGSSGARLRGCQASSNVSFAVETPGAPGEACLAVTCGHSSPRTDDLDCGAGEVLINAQSPTSQLVR